MDSKTLRFCVISFIIITLSGLLFSKGVSQDTDCTLVDEAWNAWSENDQTMVEAKFKEAISKDMTNIRAYLGLSYLYQMQNKNSQAWHNYQKVMEIDKNYYSYFYAAMMAPRVLQNIDNSESGIVERLLALSEKANPDGMLQANANEWLGQHFQRHNNLDKSKYYYDQVHAITDWTLIGPFDNISASGFEKVFDPENEYHEERSYEGKNGIPAKWFKITKVRNDRWIDFRRYFAYSDAVYYGNTFINSPKKMTVQIRVGTSGSVKVFLNDELLISCFDENNNDLDTYIAEIQLQKGWNRLLVKCGFSEITQCNFLVRITDPQGQPLRGLEISSKKQSYQSHPGSPIQLVENFAEKFFKEKIKQEPDHFENYVLLSECYLRNDKAIEAELILRKAIEKMASCALFHHHILEAYFRGEKYDEMNTTSEKLYALDPAIPSVLEFKFDQYMDSNNFDEALNMLQQLEKINPDAPEIYQNYVSYYLKKNQIEKVIETNHKAYQKYPDHWDIVYMEAILTMNTTKKHDRAIKIIRQFLKRILTEEGSIKLADFYLKASNIKKWEKTYLRLIEQFPAATGYYYRMAETYLSLQKYPQAEKYIRESIALCPGSSVFWGLLGEIKRRTEQIQEAKEAYRRALIYNPADYEAREKLRELEGKPYIFNYFKTVDIDSLIYNSPSQEQFPEDGAVILIEDVKRVVYPEGTSEVLNELLVKVFHDDGIDRYKEYWLSYNPHHEELIIEKAVVKKKDGSEIEADIENDLVVFKSLEKNDILYLKWRIRNYYSGKLSQHFWDEFNFNQYFPIQDVRYGLLMPDNISFQYQTQKMPDEPEFVRKTEDGTLYQWRLLNEPAIKPEYDMSCLNDIGKMLFISSIDNWEYLVNWYRDLAHTKTRSSYEIQEQVTALIDPKEDKTVQDKINRIYQYITENIHYSYVSFRQSALVPQKARNVLVHKIGDCKDVATLCIAMLNEVDVHADYVLVNTRDEGFNRHILPSIDFNHCIVTVKTESGVQYLDLTAQNYPVGSVPEGDLGAFALVIQEGTNTPVYLEPHHFTPRNTIRESKVFIDETNAVRVERKTMNTGARSAFLRNQLRFKGEEARIKELTESLSKDYPGVQVISFDIENIDTLSKEIVYRYVFTVPHYVNETGEFRLFKIPWADPVPTRIGLSYETRKYPYQYWPNSDTLHEEIRIQLPKNLVPVEIPEPVSYRCSIAEYSMNIRLSHNFLLVERIMIHKESTVSTSEYTEFKQFYTQVYQSDERQILLKKK